MTKPESETDPWAKVKRRQGTVIEHGPGVLGGGAWSAKAAVYLAKEVDAARAAEAAQHRREVAALEHEAEHEHAVATAREGYVKTLEAERDRLKAALSKITALDFEKFNGRHNFYSGAVMFVKAWLLAYAALTPHQGQSTDGETR